MAVSIFDKFKIGRPLLAIDSQNRERRCLERMDCTHDMGFFEGLAQTPEGRQTFLADADGEPYVIDSAQTTSLPE